MNAYERELCNQTELLRRATQATQARIMIMITSAGGTPVIRYSAYSKRDTGGQNSICHEEWEDYLSAAIAGVLELWGKHDDRQAQQAAQPKPAALTSTIEWHPASELPDFAMTVMIARRPGVFFCLGWYDGKRWCTDTGRPIDTATIINWAHLPPPPPA